MPDQSNINIDIKGDVTGNVIVGDNNVVIGSVHGGVVNVISGDMVPEIKPKQLPIVLKPRAVKNFLNRRVEIGTAASALSSGSSVEIYANDGIGKSSLLRFLAHDNISETFKDGVIYISSRNKNLEDLLQFLFETFYESDIPLKATHSQLLSSLNDKNALIFLDDNELEGKDFEELLNIAANSVFVLSSEKRKSFNDYIKPIELKGLPQEECFELMEIELGRPLSAEELAVAEKICKSLELSPLLIKQAIALSREKNISLYDLSVQFDSVSTGDEKSEIVQEDLDENKKKILVLLAIFGGTFVHAGHIGEILNIPDIKSELEDLERRELVNVKDSEYAINSANTKRLETSYEAGQIKEKCIEYFAEWAENNKDSSNQIAKEADVLIKVLECGVNISSWKNVIRLGRAIEGAFALNLMWGLWYKVIQIILRAARNIGDKSAEAWALHQSATYRLCSGDKGVAKSLFKEALDIRTSIGDLAGAEITKANLGLIGAGILSAGLVKLIIIVLLLGCIGGGVWYFTNTEKITALSIEPGYIEFEDQFVGAEGVEKTVTISLSEVNSTNIQSVEIKGEHINDFVLTGDTCSYKSLDQNSPDCDIRILFNPSDDDKRQAELVLLHDQAEKPVTIAVSGNGKKPSAILETVEELDFGSHEIGKSFIKKLNIENKGIGKLEVSGFGLDNDNFKNTSNSCLGKQLDKGASCNVSLLFSPSEKGSKSTYLVVKSNSENGDIKVKLMGEGTEVPRNPDLKINKTKLNFGEMEIGTRTNSQSVIISNNGNADLKLEFVLSNAEQKGFLFKDGCSGKSISPDNNCKIAVSFKPLSTGNAASRITFNSNDLKSPHSLSLTGSGKEKSLPVINIRPGRVEFGDIELNKSSSRKIVNVTNTGTAPLVIEKIENSSRSLAVADRCRGAKLNPGDSCKLAFSITPSRVGTQNSEIMVYSNSAESRKKLIVSWNGKKPSLKPAVINYFKPDQNEISYGDKTRICLSVTNSSRVRVTPTIGRNINYEKDCRSVSPTQTTSYKITALGEDGKSVSKNFTIYVSEQSGWCCGSGWKVYSSTKNRCKGSFYSSKSSAESKCRRNGYCCINGNVSSMEYNACIGSKGAFYNDSATAKSKCAPRVNKYYCCANGKVSYVTANECRIKLKGKTYSSRSQASNACKPFVIQDMELVPYTIKGYCCTFDPYGKPVVEQLDQTNCAKKKGTYFKDYQSAKNGCVIIY